MSKSKTNQALEAWTNRFQMKVITFLRDNDIQRQDLANMLGIAPGTISKNLKPGAMPSVDFIEKISLCFSEFRESLIDYFNVKSGSTLPLSSKDQKKTKDQLLDEALEEVTLLSERIQSLAKEIRRDNDIEDDDDSPNNGQTA